MDMPKIILDKNKCIGAYACVAVDDKTWKQTNDGKVDLIGGKKAGNLFEKEISKTEVELAKAAASACPVAAIEVKE